MLDAPEKLTQAWKVRLIQEKNPSVDHCDAQWIPAFAGMTKKDQSPTQSWVPVILAKRSPSFPRRRESIKARQSWNTRDLHHGQQTQRNALRIGVINNLKKRVRVAGVPSVDTNGALISSRRCQSMCFDNPINSWFMSSMFSRRILNRSSWGILGCFLFHFGLEVCKVTRLVSPKTCKFNTNDSTIFPYRSIYYCFIQGGLFIVCCIDIDTGLSEVMITAYVYLLGSSE